MGGCFWCVLPHPLLNIAFFISTSPLRSGFFSGDGKLKEAHLSAANSLRNSFRFAHTSSQEVRDEYDQNEWADDGSGHVTKTIWSCDQYSMVMWCAIVDYCAVYSSPSFPPPLPPPPPLFLFLLLLSNQSSGHIPAPPTTHQAGWNSCCLWWAPQISSTPGLHQIQTVCYVYSTCMHRQTDGQTDRWTDRQVNDYRPTVLVIALG